MRYPVGNEVSEKIRPIVIFKLSSQGVGVIPKSFLILSQLSVEKDGLFAWVGYSAVVIDFISVFSIKPYCLAASKIASANRAQLVVPLPQK